MLFLIGKMETIKIVSFIVKTSSVFILKKSKIPGFCFHASRELGLLISVVFAGILP